MICPFKIEGHRFFLLDQRVLPSQMSWLAPKTVAEMAQAITDMVVRGAPAIGISAAFGLTLSSGVADGDRDQLSRDAEVLGQSRPTAVNLAWALKRILDLADSVTPENWAKILWQEAELIWQQDIAMNHLIGDFGAGLLSGKNRVMTHCNAGALATGGYGTALGVLRSLKKQQPDLKVLAGETRPWGQGARLTAWELIQDGIATDVICDSMAGALMAKGEIQAVVVGADRVAANGDVANKIGTYGLAVLAAHHKIPFYVAAPHSTLDPNLARGEDIPIEQRPLNEMEMFSRDWFAPGAGVMGPAFDITPADLVEAIVTDLGVFRFPYDFSVTLDSLQPEPAS